MPDPEANKPGPWSGALMLSKRGSKPITLPNLAPLFCVLLAGGIFHPVIRATIAAFADSSDARRNLPNATRPYC